MTLMLCWNRVCASVENRAERATVRPAGLGNSAASDIRCLVPLPAITESAVTVEAGKVPDRTTGLMRTPGRWIRRRHRPEELVSFGSIEGDLEPDAALSVTGGASAVVAATVPLRACASTTTTRHEVLVVGQPSHGPSGLQARPEELVAGVTSAEAQCLPSPSAA
jgi:hypothetical protein